MRTTQTLLHAQIYATQLRLARSCVRACALRHSGWLVRLLVAIAANNTIQPKLYDCSNCFSNYCAFGSLPKSTVVPQRAQQKAKQSNKLELKHSGPTLRVAHLQDLNLALVGCCHNRKFERPFNPLGVSSVRAAAQTDTSGWTWRRFATRGDRAS